MLARFRFQPSPAPEWLKDRKVQGELKIDRLTAGDQVWSVDNCVLDWNGTAAKLSEIRAHHKESSLRGQLTADLAGALPKYHFTGQANGLDYKEGTLSVDGTADTRGTGHDFLLNARSVGTFEGEDVTFSPEAQFKTIGGGFEWSPAAKLKVTNLQAAQGFETYSGTGATQPDGRLLLDLTSGKRQVKFAGSLTK